MTAIPAEFLDARFWLSTYSRDEDIRRAFDAAFSPGLTKDKAGDDELIQAICGAWRPGIHPGADCARTDGASARLRLGVGCPECDRAGASPSATAFTCPS